MLGGEGAEVAQTRESCDPHSSLTRSTLLLILTILFSRVLVVLTRLLHYASADFHSPQCDRRFGP